MLVALQVKIFFFKKGFENSCKLSLLETFSMKFQSLFYGKNKYTISLFLLNYFQLTIWFSICNFYFIIKANFYWSSKLTFTTLSANSADNKLVTYISRKQEFDILCKLSALEKICMKCQSLFSGKNWNIISIWRLLKNFIQSAKR